MNLDNGKDYKRINMYSNRKNGFMKIVLCFILGLCFLDIAFADDEYSIDEKVKFYDDNLNPLNISINYYPGQLQTLVSSSVLFYFGNSFALIFGKTDEKNYRQDFIEAIDKCIEWASVARKNSIHDMTKEIKDSHSLVWLSGMRFLESMELKYVFLFGEITKGKESAALMVNYRSSSDINNRRPGHWLVFLEEDFAGFKNIFSDEYLKRFDEMEKTKQQQSELFQ
jgi:hypothetical protein